MSASLLPYTQAGALREEPACEAWMIRSFWGKAHVGMIGGAPKCCKSWLGLDMAVSVASGTPCLDHFPVDARGPVLVFLAEDTLPLVRNRIQSICQHRNVNIQALELYVITAPSLRLDLQSDQDALKRTLKEVRPRMLLLDPLVRMHRIDENSASEVSAVLGFLRELQRAHDCAIVLAHHASKKHRAQPGQTLRGSSDLHAFGDSNAYLARRQNRLILTLEHRAAKPPDPFELELFAQENESVHLAIVSDITADLDMSLEDRAMMLLQKQATPLPRSEIRELLHVNNQRLGQALTGLQKKGRIVQQKTGWSVLQSPSMRKVKQEDDLQLSLFDDACLQPALF